jgi:hypothetical protein
MTDFPYSMFPIKLIHIDGKDKKTCWFQSENHMDKYIDRMKLDPKEYEVFTNNVEIVGKVTRRKGRKK